MVGVTDAGHPGYRTALLDWLACAAAGTAHPAPRAARTAADGLAERVAAAGCAGHVLDFDDTYEPGLVHASAPVAPAALLLAAELDRSLGEALAAFAAGWEATAAFARASHPTLYERGWHPTAVCGTAGAAVASAKLLRLGRERTSSAVALALLRAGGLRAAFGSQGKAIQVGAAAAAGLHAARLAEAGAEAPLEEITRGAAGFESAYGGRWAPPGDGVAIGDNWIKAYPCCLGAHAPIEAAAALATSKEPMTVVVHPVARQAAALDDVRDGLEAKFSIPYLVAFTILHGPPGVADFEHVDEGARTLARDRVVVSLDPGLGEMEARIELSARTAAQVSGPLGSPARPMDPAALDRKVRTLAGERLDGILDDLSAPVALAVAAAGLS
jgi:2-methylcitrate dehydratase PrpD